MSSFLWNWLKEQYESDFLVVDEEGEISANLLTFPDPGRKNPLCIIENPSYPYFDTMCYVVQGKFLFVSS
jgi:hypothetical protein